MSLLGTPLLVVLWICTVLAPIGTYWAWRRVRGPRVLRATQRLGMIGVCQLAALCLVAAAINDYGLFYKSWGEASQGLETIAGLRSAATGNPAPTAAVDGISGGPGTAGGIRVESSSGGPNSWARTGRIDSVLISGGASGLSNHAFVYLPPQYFQAKFQGQYFPAVEVFTGYPGIDRYLVSRLKYPQVLQRLVDSHSARPAVLVMMRPSVTFPRDTECTDVPAGPQAETFFAADVPTQISAHFRVQPTGWGAIGDSTGGYCAVKLAMLNPTMFPAAVSLSGYYYALRDHTTGDLWSGSSVIRNSNNLFWRLRHLPAPPISIMLGTSPSESGADGYAEAQSFAHAVRAPMSIRIVSVPHGGHNLATWSAELPTGLRFLANALPPTCPAPTIAPPGQS